MIQKLFIYVWSAIGAMHRYAFPLVLLHHRRNTASLRRYCLRQYAPQLKTS
jgi:hypothetical protein